MARGALSKAGKGSLPETPQAGLTSGFPPGGGTCRKQQTVKGTPGVPSVTHRVRNPRSSLEMGVPSLTSSCGFKTPRCHELWWRLRMRLGAGIALSRVYTSSSSPDSPLPSQGSTSQDRLESPSSFSTLQSSQTCSPILQEGRECLFAGLFPVLYRRVWIFFFFFFF